MLQFVMEERPKKNRILLVGLPGLGLVGKLAVDYLISEKKSKKLVTIYSSDFPPQVVMIPGEPVDSMKAEIHEVRIGRRVFYVLTGNVQPTTPAGHFELVTGVLDLLQPKEVITLGGYRVGQVREKPRVFGAHVRGTDLKRYEAAGAEFGKVQGNIFGAAGMFLMGAELYGVPALCLMAETHGNFVDPIGAKAVLEVLSKAFKIKLDLSKLAEEGEISKAIVKGIEEQVKKIVQPKRETDESYIR